MYTTVSADKNNEAKQEPSPCNGSIYSSRINSEEAGEEENVDVVIAMGKRPTWDSNFVKTACR